MLDQVEERLWEEAEEPVSDGGYRNGDQEASAASCGEEILVNDHRNEVGEGERVERSNVTDAADRCRRVSAKNEVLKC